MLNQPSPHATLAGNAVVLAVGETQDSINQDDKHLGVSICEDVGHRNIENDFRAWTNRTSGEERYDDRISK